MSHTQPRTHHYLLAGALVLAVAGEAPAEWRYSCPKCNRDLGQAVGPRPTRCSCGWQEGDRVRSPQDGGNFDFCMVFSCMGGMSLVAAAGILAVIYLPKLAMGKPRKRRLRSRRREDDDS